MGNNNLGLPEYQKQMSIQEKLKAYYNKAEIGNSIFIVHKRSKDHQEYKFFCTSFKGKDYILVAPKHWNAEFATHSDLEEIFFYLNGYDKNDLKKRLELLHTEFATNTFHGTIGRDPKENKFSFYILDDSPDILLNDRKLKEIPESIQRVHKRLLTSLNKIIQSNKAKLKTNKSPLKPRVKNKKTQPKPKRAFRK